MFYDSALAAEVETRLDGEAWYFRFYAAHAVNRFARDPWLAARFLAGHRGRRPAILHYSRFVAFWADSDPELVPLREEVQARRDALACSRG